MAAVRVRCALLLTAVLCLAGPAWAGLRTVHGFVTAVHSPDSFDIADYTIICKPRLAFKVQRDQYDAFAPGRINHQDIRVGTEIEVHGDYNGSRHELKADSVKVFFFDTVNIDRIALMENPVHLERTASGAWQGEFVEDGQRVVVSGATTVRIAQSLGELDSEKPQNTSAASRAKTSAGAPVPLDSLDSLRLGSFVHYRGTLSPADGSVAATAVEFEDGGIEPGIIKQMKKSSPKVKEPDYAAGKSGQLTVGGGQNIGMLKFGVEYRLPASREALDYVTRIGNSLIPEQQRSLPDGDPFKIPFRFYLVSEKEPIANGYPSGAVVVSTGLFRALNNEAELAFLLARQMAFVAEDTSWRNVDYHERGSPGFVAVDAALPAAVFLLSPAGIAVSGAIVHSALDDPYGRSLMNQADRVAVDWMSASGYDVREAAQACKVLATVNWYKRVDSVFGLQANYDLRRSYVQSYVENQYPKLDDSALRKDSDDFHRIGRQIAHPRH